MTDNNPHIPQPSLLFIFVILCYFALHIILRIKLTGTLDYDEAEQAVLSQWLLAGYTEQPPLYTWIQRFLFSIFSPGTFAVALMKNSLLFFTYLFVYLSSLRILKDGRGAILATVSLLFIPQIGWESQRDMTHTVLVVCATAATLYQGLRTANNKNLTNYLLFGLCLTIGFLGKANFTIFIAIMFLALLWTKEGRLFILNRYFPLALLLPLLLCGEYLWWMYNNQDIVFSSAYKFKRALLEYWLTGPESLIQATILFLFPGWLICLIIFPAGFKPSANLQPDFEHRFISRYMIFFLLLLLTIVLVFKVTYVKDRWLQPMLFAAPIYFFSRLLPEQITQGKFKAYLWTALAAALIIYTTFTLRIVGASWFNSFSRMNYPFKQMVAKLHQQGFDNGLIVTDKRFLAGNMRLLFPDSTAIIPDYHFEKQPLKRHYNKVLILWMPKESENIPIKLAEFLKDNYNIDVNTLKTEKIIKPYIFVPKDKKDKQTVILGSAITPLPNPG